MTTPKKKLRYATKEEAMPIIEKIIKDNPETLKLLGGGKGCKASDFYKGKALSNNEVRAGAEIAQQLLDAFAKYRTREKSISWKDYADENLTLNETEKIEDVASLASDLVMKERSLFSEKALGKKLNYLTEDEAEEKDMALMQIALGLRTCEKVGDAVELLEDAYTLGERKASQKTAEAILALPKWDCPFKDKYEECILVKDIEKYLANEKPQAKEGKG